MIKRAKDLIIDFFNYALLLFLIIFCLIFFIVGNRLAVFTEFIKLLMPLAYFGIFFLVRLKFDREALRKRKKEGNLNEIIKYLTKLDKIKDLIIISILSIIILIIAMIDGYVDVFDILQAIIAFLTMFFWHLALIRKGKNINESMCITYFDKIKDEMVIFLLPIIIISIVLVNKNVNMVDFLQAFIPFLAIYVWHQYYLVK